jgi:hypothetical protein
MEQTMTPDAAEVSRAVVVWTGWSRAPRPARDEGRLVEEFGEERALELLPLVRRLTDDFYSSDAWLTRRTLTEIGAAAAANFRAKHPEVSDEAVEALTWCYTYDYR